ncbi:hypothetical protein DSUL_50110 [Desulfovibrionales bacterium]
MGDGGKLCQTLDLYERILQHFFEERYITTAIVPLDQGGDFSLYLF